MKPFTMMIFLITILSLTGIAEDLFADNPSCLRCHAMATMAYRDSLTGGLVNLHVSPEDYEESQHGGLDCLDCHTDKFESFPHPAEVRTEHLACMDCHEDEGIFTERHFTAIQEEFENSVHAERLGEYFSCFSCHEPHTFFMDKENAEQSARIKADNNLCLNCHETSVTHSRIALDNTSTISLSHAWLPELEKHWASVRCIDCHGGSGDGHLHTIQPAPESSRDCSTCHSNK